MPATEPTEAGDRVSSRRQKKLTATMAATVAARTTGDAAFAVIPMAETATRAKPVNCHRADVAIALNTGRSLRAELAYRYALHAPIVVPRVGRAPR